MDSNTYQTSGPAEEGEGEALKWIRGLFAQGGPKPSDYPKLDRCVRRVADQLHSGSLSRAKLASFWQSFGSHYLSDTLQGRSFAQPCGYAGDFETIDRIYLRRESDNPRFAGWDRFFHSQAAPQAVRNRKDYFKALVERTEKDASGLVHVLNIGSGPCRDILEYFSAHPKSRVRFTCVDQDPEAIRFARGLCKDYLGKIEFVQANAFRFRSPRPYDLVWSAGVLDYLNDRLAIRFIRRAFKAVRPGGEVAIGNFALANPSQSYMEVVGRWYLYHRSPTELARLGAEAVATQCAIRVGMESEAVNLFLHMLRACETVAQAS